MIFANNNAPIRKIHRRALAPLSWYKSYYALPMLSIAVFVIWFMNKFTRPIFRVFASELVCIVLSMLAFQTILFFSANFPSLALGPALYTFADLIRHGNVVEGIAMHYCEAALRIHPLWWRSTYSHPLCIIFDVGFTRTHSYCTNLKSSCRNINISEPVRQCLCSAFSFVDKNGRKWQ